MALTISSVAWAATTDFVADGDVTIASVVHGAFTADLLIMNGSKAESWNFDSGDFKVTNPDPSALFKVGSNSGTVRSIRVQVQGESSEAACANNTTQGTDYVTLPSGTNVYLVYPSDEACGSSSSNVGGGGGGGS